MSRLATLLVLGFGATLAAPAGAQPAERAPAAAPASSGEPAPAPAAEPPPLPATELAPLPPIEGAPTPFTPGLGPDRVAIHPSDAALWARRFRGSWLVWQNTVTTQTVGIGGSYQSADPTYEMSAWLRPRYYFIDEPDAIARVGGRIDVIREFTNSDTTTEEGETTLSDATLYVSYSHRLAGHGKYGTWGRISVPSLTFPTSKFSYSNGTYLGLGGAAAITEAVSLAGKDAPVLSRVQFSASVLYNHTFTRSVVPTNPGLRRVRMDPDGNTVPGDLLVGAAFPEHELQLDARMYAEVTERLAFYVETSYRPTWKYGFGNVELCNVDPTGCAPVMHPDNPTRFVVLTQFETFLSYDLTDELGISIGYVNLEQQPGPDGQRRSILWSPGAQFYVQLIGSLDAIYLALSGHRGEGPTDTALWL